MIKVGFQGVKGAYSEQASINFFKDDIEFTTYEDFYSLFNGLKNNEVDYITVPIENSLAGSIHENYDHIQQFGFHIEGQYVLRVSHNLIGLKDAKLEDIKEVYSHPQALAQCNDFFKQNPQIRKVPFYDTAGSVKMVKEKNDKSIAGIASVKAAQEYDLNIIKKEIESDKTNYTRFWIVSKRDISNLAYNSNKEYKSSIVFSLKSIPGALFKSLSVFYFRDIDLLKIESRPLVGAPWQYLFYVDFKGHFKEEKVQNALKNLEEIAENIKLFGSYEFISRSETQYD